MVVVFFPFRIQNAKAPVRSCCETVATGFTSGSFVLAVLLAG